MISIIVPVYNADMFLSQCINSIVQQQYASWECILVDDGSTDGSGRICDDWKQRDKRITVIHQKNQGVSVARNRGIEGCNGEYICFIDADDWVEPLFLGEMLHSLQDAEIVISGQIREYQLQRSAIYKPDSTATFELIPDSANTFVRLNSLFLLYALHGKLYRAELIKKYKIYFPVDCNYGEDLLFNYAYLNHVKKLSTVNGAYYHYRIGTDTLSTKLRIDQFETDYYQWKILKAFHERHGLFNKTAKLYLYDRLWGIVYDGIFLYPRFADRLSSAYLKAILQIEEIKELRDYGKEFACSFWIKWAVLHRCSIIFRLYFFYMGLRKQQH